MSKRKAEAALALLCGYADSGDEGGSVQSGEVAAAPACPEVAVAVEPGAEASPSRGPAWPCGEEYEALPEAPESEEEAPPADAAARPQPPPPSLCLPACAPAARLARVTLPGAPAAPCRPELAAKLRRFHGLVAQGTEGVTQALRRGKGFRNPYLSQKSAEHFQIDQSGSVYPAAVFDPQALPPQDRYDQLAQAQRQREEAREAERRNRSALQFVSAGGGPGEGGAALRSARDAAAAIASRVSRA